MAGSTVFAQHDDQHDVYLVLAGHLRLTAYSMAGREVVFHDLHPGDLVGELSAIDGRPRGTNLTAVSDAELARLEVADFDRLLHEAPDFAMAIMRQLTRLVRKLNGRIHLLTATVPTRICAELLRLASFNLIADNTARLAPAPRHLDIANRINTHREAVSRTIGDLQRQHVVRRGQGELVVVGCRRLAAIRRRCGLADERRAAGFGELADRRWRPHDSSDTRCAEGAATAGHRRRAMSDVPSPISIAGPLAMSPGWC